MKNNNVVSLKQPEESSVDTLTELLRNGAKDLIRKAVEVELQEFLNENRYLQPGRVYKRSAIHLLLTDDAPLSVLRAGLFIQTSPI